MNDEGTLGPLFYRNSERSLVNHHDSEEYLSYQQHSSHGLSRFKDDSQVKIYAIMREICQVMKENPQKFLKNSSKIAIILGFKPSITRDLFLGNQILKATNY